MKYTIETRQLETLPSDVTVHQLIAVKQERMRRKKAVRRQKLRKLKNRIALILTMALFGLLSTFLIICVLTGAMYLTGGLTLI